MSGSHYAYSTNKKHLGKDQKGCFSGNVMILYGPGQGNDSLGTSGFLSVTDKGWARRSPRCLHIYLYASTISLYLLMSSELSKYSICYTSVPSFQNVDLLLYIILFYLFSSLKCHWAWIFYSCVSLLGTPYPTAFLRVWSSVKSHSWIGQIILIIYVADKVKWGKLATHW